MKNNKTKGMKGEYRDSISHDVRKTCTGKHVQENINGHYMY